MSNFMCPECGRSCSTRKELILCIQSHENNEKEEVKEKLAAIEKRMEVLGKELKSLCCEYEDLGGICSFSLKTRRSNAETAETETDEVSELISEKAKDAMSRASKTNSQLVEDVKKILSSHYNLTEEEAENEIESIAKLSAFLDEKTTFVTKEEKAEIEELFRKTVKYTPFPINYLIKDKLKNIEVR